MQLILASTSPYRKQQLESLGINFRAIAPFANEEELKTKHPATADLALFLAKEKALSLRAQYPKEWILGADQLVSFKGDLLGKPKTRENACKILGRLQDDTHELVTSFYLSGEQTHFSHTDITKLKMRRLTPEEIESYVEQDDPLDCAGSYKLEKRGIALFEKIESEDFSAIQGLPLIAFSTCWMKATGQLPFRI